MQHNPSTPAHPLHRHLQSTHAALVDLRDALHSLSLVLHDLHFALDHAQRRNASLAVDRLLTKVSRSLGPSIG